ncbi:unnamed protein product [Gadus morhua 'NCC']
MSCVFPRFSDGYLHQETPRVAAPLEERSRASPGFGGSRARAPAGPSPGCGEQSPGPLQSRSRAVEGRARAQASPRAVGAAVPGLWGEQSPGQGPSPGCGGSRARVLSRQRRRDHG